MPKPARGQPRTPRGVDPAILLQVVLLSALPSAATLAAVAAGVATSVTDVLGWAFGSAGVVWLATLPLAFWLHRDWLRRQ
jgi:membrane protein implicated in regulation of membrane protease activity